MFTELTSTPTPFPRPAITPSRLAYISRLHAEAVRLVDEARGILSVDPRDDAEIAFQIAEVTRRVQRLNTVLARGPDHAG
jgi:hypothetical protein